MSFFKYIKSFYDENSMIKIHPKPDRNSQKLPFCTALKAKIECPFIPPFGPQPPHTQWGRGVLKLYLIFCSSIISPEIMSCSQNFDLSMTEF